jgi:hypothetical protein
MLRVARFTLTAASIVLTLGGCQDATAPDGAARPPSAGPMMSQASGDQASLVQHIIAPRATDPDIDFVPDVTPELNQHYVLLDPSARDNSKLLVFMPGTRNVPASWQRLDTTAARLGYHVIGLMYKNDVEVVGACTGSPDPDCSGNMRREILDGSALSSAVSVSPANGIDNRLTKLLLYLDAYFPDEGWSKFLKHGEPKWSRIAIAGQSQGAGQAALIGKLHRVSRVVMFSGPPDARIPGQIDPWVSIGETPMVRYFALFHDRDHLVAGIRANLAALVTKDFGTPGIVEGHEPPYGGTHILFTDLEPTLGYARPNPHQSTAKDNNTPIGPDGVPVLREAWHYLLGARDADEEVADDQDEQDERRARMGEGTRR